MVKCHILTSSINTSMSVPCPALVLVFTSFFLFLFFLPSLPAYITTINNIIIIIIIKSLINSAALKKTTRCRHMSFSAAEQGVPSGVVQKLPLTVTKTAGQLAGCSKCLDRKQQSSCDRWLWLSTAHSVCWRQPTSDADIQQTQPPVGKAQPDMWVLVLQTLVDQHRDLLFYPLVNQKPVQIPQDCCDVVKFACSGDQPCCGILNSLQLSNDAVSSSNQ